MAFRAVQPVARQTLRPGFAGNSVECLNPAALTNFSNLDRDGSIAFSPGFTKHIAISTLSTPEILRAPRSKRMVDGSI